MSSLNNQNTVLAKGRPILMRSGKVIARECSILSPYSSVSKANTSVISVLMPHKKRVLVTGVDEQLFAELTANLASCCLALFGAFSLILSVHLIGSDPVAGFAEKASLGRFAISTQASFVKRLSADADKKVQDEAKSLTSLIQAKYGDDAMFAPYVASVILSESKRANIDPMLVAAVVDVESGFRHSVTSHKGAHGLMQLMPDTARYLRAKFGGSSGIMSSSRTGQPNVDIKNNLRIGIVYLKYLDKMFNGNRENTLMAYNWGPGNMKKALKGEVPVPGETKNYARKVISNHRSFKQQFASILSSETVLS